MLKIRGMGTMAELLELRKKLEAEGARFYRVDGPFAARRSSDMRMYMDIEEWER